MSTPPLRKQVSLFLPLSDWKALREEAARHRISMTELCRRWMEPSMLALRTQGPREPEEPDEKA